MGLDCILDNTKELAKGTKTDIVDRAVDIFHKFQDLAHKYPALRPLQSVVRNREHKINKNINEYIKTAEDVFKLPKEDTAILEKRMIEADKFGVRITDEELMKQFKMDGQIHQFNENQIRAYKAYTEVMDTAFKDGRMVNVEAIEDKAIREEMRTALEDFMVKAKESKNNAFLRDRIKKDKNTTIAQKEYQKQLLDSYLSGYMQRNRGSGDHAIEIRDSSGKLIHKEIYNNLDLTLDKKAMKANAIEKAKANLDEQKARNIKLLNGVLEKAEKREAAAIDPVKKDKAKATIARLKESIKKQESREITLDGLSDARMEDSEKFMDRLDIRSALNGLDSMKIRAVSLEKKSLEAQGLKGKELNNALEQYKIAYDASIKSQRDALMKQYDSQSFQKHSIHRARNYISGVQEGSLKEGLAKYIYQAASSRANIETSMHAFSEISKIDNAYIRKIGTEKINEVMRNATNAEEMARKVGSLAFVSQFAVNPASGLINLVGNGANFSSVLIERGMPITQAHGLLASSTAKASKMMFQYFSEVNSHYLKNVGKSAMDKTSYTFQDFINNYKFVNDKGEVDETLSKVMKKAVADGLTMNITEKEFADIGKNMSKVGRLVEISTLMMSQTERLNRLATIMASVKMSKMDNQKYLKDLIAEKFVAERDAFGELKSEEDKILEMSDHITGEINAVYGKGNRSIAESGSSVRAMIMRNAFPFQSYATHQLALYSRYLQATMESFKHVIEGADKNDANVIAAKNGAFAFMNMNATLGIIGGVGAIPIAKAISYANSLFSDDDTSWIDKMKARGDTIDNVLSYGVPGMLGLDITGSTEASVPYIGGSYMMSRWKQGDAMQRIARGENPFYAVATGGAFTMAELKNVDRAIYDSDLMTKHGAIETINGEEIKRTTGQAILKFMGINHTDISKAKAEIMISKGLDRLVSGLKDNLNYKFTEGKLEQDDIDSMNARLEVINKAYGTNYEYEPKEKDPRDFKINVEE